MGNLAGRTNDIGLATGSAILPLRHPIHTAKAAASLDVLSVASDDRPEEFPAFGRDREQRSERFHESFNTVRLLWQEQFPSSSPNSFGHISGEGDLVPKPHERDTIPMYVTGCAGQDLDWIACRADGWIFFPRELPAVQKNVDWWHTVLERNQLPRKPYLQSLYIDLLEDPGEGPTQLHLGLRSGRRYLLTFLEQLEAAGVNHVMLVLKFASRPITGVLDEIGQEILPHFKPKRQK